MILTHTHTFRSCKVIHSLEYKTWRCSWKGQAVVASVFLLRLNLFSVATTMLPFSSVPHAWLDELKKTQSEIIHTLNPPHNTNIHGGTHESTCWCLTSYMCWSSWRTQTDSCSFCNVCFTQIRMNIVFTVTQRCNKAHAWKKTSRYCVLFKHQMENDHKSREQRGKIAVIRMPLCGDI